MFAVCVHYGPAATTANGTFTLVKHVVVIGFDG